MAEQGDLTVRLRDRIVTGLHVGRLRGGQRLPGVRALSRELGANPRTILHAFRALEREGLVEVRGRSGVYVVRQEGWGEGLLAETGRWLGGILLEAWKRNIPLADLADLIRRCTGESSLRAACVAESEDDRRAICEELSRGFGIASEPVAPAAITAALRGAAPVPAAVREADLVVATPFHAGPARAVADSLGRPLVMATLHPELVEAVERRLRGGRLTVVCVDPAFGARLRALLRAGSALRVVLAGDAERLARLDPEEPVLLTRAAQDRLGDLALTPLVPFAPFLSPDSARALTELIVRLHMERSHRAG